MTSTATVHRKTHINTSAPTTSHSLTVTVTSLSTKSAPGAVKRDLNTPMTRACATRRAVAVPRQLRAAHANMIGLLALGVRTAMTKEAQHHC
jgi:hypothetical protein